jgi:hypothetical protein
MPRPSYEPFFQAFVVPVLLIIDTIRSQAARRRLAQPASFLGPSGSAGRGMAG